MMRVVLILHLEIRQGENLQIKEYAPYIHAGYDFGKHWKEDRSKRLLLAP